EVLHHRVAQHLAGDLTRHPLGLLERFGLDFEGDVLADTDMFCTRISKRFQGILDRLPLYVEDCRTEHYVHFSVVDHTRRVQNCVITSDGKFQMSNGVSSGSSMVSSSSSRRARKRCSRERPIP